jgi:hypothetical protein
VITLCCLSWPHFRLESKFLKVAYRLRYQVITLCGCPIYGFRDRNLYLEVPKWPHFRLETNTLKPRVHFEISGAHFIYVLLASFQVRILNLKVGYRLRFQVLTLCWFSSPHLRLESNSLKVAYRLRSLVITLCGCPIYGFRDRNLCFRWPHFGLESKSLKVAYRLRFQVLRLCGFPIYGVGDRNLFWRSVNGLISS